MISKILFVAFIIVHILACELYSQTKADWTQHCGYQVVRSMATYGNICWIGNYGGGLCRINMTSGDVTRYTSLNSGLPSNIVTCVATGLQGEIWVATEEGIASFNGSDWRLFNQGNAPFASNRMSAIDIDDKGRVWVASDNGLYCWNGAQWTDVLEKYPGFPLSIFSGISRISCVGSDIWIGLWGSVVRLSGGEWENFRSAGASFFSDEFLTISSDGTYWFQSSLEKKLVGLKGDLVQSTALPANGRIGTLLIDPLDRKWISIADSLYWQKSDEWSIVPNPQENGSYLDPLGTDDSGCIWLRVSNGLLRYNPILNVWKTFWIPFEHDFTNYHMSQLTVDSENRLWGLSTRDLYSRSSNEWIMHEPIKGEYYSVEKIALDKQSRLRVNASEYGNLETTLYCSVKNSPGVDAPWTDSKDTFSDLSTLSLSCFNPTSNTWFFHISTRTTYQGLLLAFDGENWQRLPYPYGDSTKTITSLEASEDGALWALADGRELLRNLHGTWEKSLITSGTSLVSDTITGILTATEDTVWVGTAHAGLARFDGSKWQRFDTLLAGCSHLTPLSYDRKRGELWCAAFSSNQIFSVSSSKFIQDFSPIGLYCFNGTTGKLYTTVNSGIFDSEVHSVAADENGLWVASSYGLAYWNRGTAPVKRPSWKSTKGTQQNSRVKLINGKPLRLHLNSPGAVTISVFNLTGRLVKHLDLGEMKSGEHTIRLFDNKSGASASSMFIADVKISGVDF